MQKFVKFLRNPIVFAITSLIVFVVGITVSSGNTDATVTRTGLQFVGVFWLVVVTLVVVDYFRSRTQARAVPVRVEE